MRKLIFYLTITLLTATILTQGAIAQTRYLNGTVKDENGNALSAATVSVKNSKVSTVTGPDGNFKLTLPGNAKRIVVSFVGMQTEEFGIPASGLLNAVLKQSASSLSDVVVIAYGTVKKKDLTGSVEVIKGADLVKGSPTNIVSAMQGKIAGAVISQSDGAPGAGINITIRGSNSFLGTQPLYVIDGIPYVMGNNEAISILKDASATAIYGSRGANGVVIITTKQGKKGADKLELNANTSISK